MSKTQSLRVGLIGANGRWGPRAHVPALTQLPETELYAVCTAHADTAQAAADKFGVKRAYGDDRSLHADPAVEAVYIPLPNHLHVPWTIRAAEAGKHVLCEKPIALSAKEARQLLDVRARTGVHIGEAFMVRSHPQWLAVKELVASGRIGELRVVAGHFAYFKRDPDDVRSVPEWGGGGLMDVGCYPITMSRWLFGEEPDAVIGIVDRDPELRVDRIASGMLRFPSGGQATFTCAMQLVHYQRMQLHGTQGRIEVQIPFNAPNDRPCRVFVDDGRELGDRSAEAIEFPAVDQYTLQGDNFSAAIRGEREIPVGVEDAVANMAVIDAVFRSVESGRWERPQ